MRSTMLPPILEIHVVWHPGDDASGKLMQCLLSHFHGNAYRGLLGGAIEVFARSAPWQASGVPRPIPLPPASAPGGVEAAELTAVVVLAGMQLARAVERAGSDWGGYLGAIVASDADRVRVFPVRPASGAAPDDSRLLALLTNQCIADDEPARTCRDLAQAIAQWATAPPSRLKVFISHTKHDDAGSGLVARLIAQVRERIDVNSRLASFFDSNALQPGEDWDRALRTEAAGQALLALRTDLYAGREWCQREMLLAKHHGVPVVVLDAPLHGEPRGSFLMDHVPRVPVRRSGDGWLDADIDTGLARLVDACLQRQLWLRQEAAVRAAATLQVDWWAPSAPEPATLVGWMRRQPAGGSGALTILHPDPPLGAEERRVLDGIAALAGRSVDILTPRLLAARGA